jgi:transketolase
MERCPFFWVGAGDLAKSILTGKAERVRGILSREHPRGRGIRFGIAEQNMAMMSVSMAADCLPGGFRPMTAFASYGVFSVMMANAVRMALIGNDVNPRSRAFFILLAAHDGPETGEDGPTHQGLFWMSLYSAYPGIKVYKPLDANEAIEMLFHAVSRGEPVAFSVVRPPVPVFRRGDGVPPAREAIHGAYVFRDYRNNGKPKIALAVCGGSGDGQRAGGPARAGERGRLQDHRRHFARALRGAARTRPRARRADSFRRGPHASDGLPQRLERVPLPVPAAAGLEAPRFRD